MGHQSSDGFPWRVDLTTVAKLRTMSVFQEFDSESMGIYKINDAQNTYSVWTSDEKLFF